MTDIPLPEPAMWYARGNVFSFEAIMQQGWRLEARELFDADQVRAYAAACVAAEREPGNVIRLALLHAAFRAREGLTVGALREAANTLFGKDAVYAAVASIRGPNVELTGSPLAASPAEPQA